MQTQRRIYPPTYYAVFLVAAIILHYIFPIAQVIQSPLTYIGLVLIAVGIGIALWGNQLFTIRKTTVKPFETSTLLITDGPYRLTRNPMYLGMVLFLLGLAILLGSLITFLAPIAMFIILNTRFIRYEEAMLLESFGEQYERYKQQVRRWL